MKATSFRWRTVFLRVIGAGVVALAFNFLLRFGMIAPFPPESAIEAFLKVIPESIQEPAVQKLGDLAGLLGLLVASIITIIVYGILGVVFQRLLLPRLARARSPLTVLEAFLAYSIVPWLLFGLVLLPLFSVSFFGLSSIFATSDSVWLFPLALLIVQLVYSYVMYYEFKQAELVSPTAVMLSSALPTMNKTNGGNLSRNASESSTQSVTRRSFIEKGVLVVGVIALAATGIDTLLTSNSASSSSPATSSSGTPIDLQDAPAIFKDLRLAPLVDAEVTSNDSFYRVAIDLFDPAVDGSSWELKVGGLVGQPKNYTLAGFENFFTPVTQYNTFECVSNTINGNLVGNAKWTGVRVADLLKDAGGVSPSAKYVVFSSVDGYSVGIPISRAMMSDSILAYQMNDQALPQKHGYPLRAVMPGLYGMMSAKWMNMVHVVDSTYQGYWQTRGWSNDGTVQTVAFITIPGDQESISLSKNNGTVMLGGVAYAGNRGISLVEVSTDQGKTWQSAQLKKGLSNATWALWAFEWTPPSKGSFPVYARATDGTGAVQTSQATDTFPNGATGYAMIGVNVAD